MISRAKKANDRVKSATNGELDLLDKEALKDLKK